MQVKDTCPKIVNFKEITHLSDPRFPLAAVLIRSAGDVGCKVVVFERCCAKSWRRFQLYGVREEQV